MERKVPNCSLCQFPWHKYSHHGWFQTINSLATGLWDLARIMRMIRAPSGTPLGMYVCVCMCLCVYISICIFICTYILFCISDFHLWTFSFCLKYVLLTSIECLLVVNHALAELFENRFISLTLIENSFILHLFLLSIEC